MITALNTVLFVLVAACYGGVWLVLAEIQERVGRCLPCADQYRVGAGMVVMTAVLLLLVEVPR